MGLCKRFFKIASGLNIEKCFYQNVPFCTKKTLSAQCSIFLSTYCVCSGTRENMRIKVHSGRKMDEIPKKIWKESNCTIIIFQKKKFEIMCHMMGCNNSSGKHRQRGGTAFAGFCPPPLKSLRSRSTRLVDGHL